MEARLAQEAIGFIILAGKIYERVVIRSVSTNLDENVKSKEELLEVTKCEDGVWRVLRD